MYEQIRADMLFIILYSGVTFMAMLASCYLLLRRANAIAPDITPPLRLRRWTGAFLASIALSHVWYMPIFFLSSSEDRRLCDLIGGLLDSMTYFPLAIVVLLTMLQDRRRPLWPVGVMMAPIVAGNAWDVVTRSYALLPILYVYYLLMCLGLILYMIRASRQYGRWLRDNFSDLEHKEVWQSIVVLAVMLLMFAVYALTNESQAYVYAMLVVSTLLVGYLLWRVETLSDLGSLVQPESAIAVDEVAEEEAAATDKAADDDHTAAIRHRQTSSVGLSKNIGPLLKQHCEEPQLYLQYDISLAQLATLIGINRSYLSRYFASQGITYNAYINDLRIQHFVELYREAVATHQPVTAQQLAYQSGFRNYNTFSAAFKRMMGMNATEWMLTVKS